MRIERAFIFAAGMGRRLRPYTDTIPKPMVQVLGKPLIDHIIDKLISVGVTEIVVNTHYKGDVLKAHLKKRENVTIHISDESEEILETGGGLKKALSYFKNEPLFAINGDAYWTDPNNESTLENLAKNWNEQEGDLLLLLERLENMTLTTGSGDYDLGKAPHIIRNKCKKGVYAFTGIRILHPRVFKNSSNGAFSFLEQMDYAESQHRLLGTVHQGRWYHISTPQDLEAVNSTLKEKA